MIDDDEDDGHKIKCEILSEVGSDFINISIKMQDLPKGATDRVRKDPTTFTRAIQNAALDALGGRIVRTETLGTATHTGKKNSPEDIEKLKQTMYKSIREKDRSLN